MRFALPEQFAEIVFPLSLKQVFSYAVPEALEGLLQPGMRCSVSFGRRQTVGLIIGITFQPPAHVKKVKPIDSLLDTAPSLTPDLLELGKWIADYYYCSLGEALFAMLPTGYRKNPKAFLGLTDKGIENIHLVEKVLEQTGTLRGVNVESLKVGKIPLTARTRELAETLKRESLGVLRLEGAPDTSRSKKTIRTAGTGTVPELHPQQETAFRAIEQALNLHTFRTFLLHGVTGSGKTEVYLRAIEQVIARGQQAIVLIPEIALTPQTVERFTGRFGNQVAVLHSRLSTGERTYEWQRIALGDAKVAVGARSALFAPARNLGLIVVDEEHESSYKQEDAPRYHARDAAVKMAQIRKCVALLGSATPSLESVHNARLGKYQLLSMPQRVNKKPLPRIKAVDLRDEWKVRGEDRPVLSLALREAIRDTLDKKEQALLFLNRRGFNTVTLCMKCGEQVHCPSCSIPLTYHRGAKPGLLCHYCNWTGPIPEKCAGCGDGPIQQVGLGTERLEEELKMGFPHARIERMDLDTTRRQGSHEDILNRFRRHETDLLVGTQMIAKGHDFPGVTLVGVVGADVGLALPDFRASERVFQLLVQVAGRAGRAEKEGTIYLQTFHTEHVSIRSAIRHDTQGFWERELELRKDLGYPPFMKLGLLVYRAKDEKKAHLAADKAAEILRREAQRNGVEVVGPAPAGIFKLRGHYRFQVMLKAAKPQIIRQLLQILDSRYQTPTGVFRVVDLDPQSML
jgi:primosomal protein N' (replication factor Y)